MLLDDIVLGKVFHEKMYSAISGSQFYSLYRMLPVSLDSKLLIASLSFYCLVWLVLWCLTPLSTIFQSLVLLPVFCVVHVSRSLVLCVVFSR
jgi:hypothetical protein